MEDLKRLEAWRAELVEQLQGIKLELANPQLEWEDASELMGETADKQLQLSIIEARIGKLKAALNTNAGQ